MSRVCSICSHPDRSKIEASIAAGASNRSIALQFGMSHMAVQRHASDHLAAAIKEVQQAQLIQSGSIALSRMARGEKIVDEIIAFAWGDEDNAKRDESKDKAPDLALKALAELRRQVELRAKLEGEIDEHTITITSIPEWRELRTLLLDALSVHPQAKMAVIRALEAYNREQSA